MFDSTENDEVPEVRLLTAEDVARILAVSKRYAYTLMETGQIPSVWIGRCIRVYERDLLVYIDNLPRNRAKDA